MPVKHVGWRASAERLAAARRAEANYRRRLNDLVLQIRSLIIGIFHPEDPATASHLENALHEYADRIRPWAEGVAARMLRDVDARNKAAWTQQGKEIGVALRGMAESAPIGTEFKALQDYQVDLITSIPRERAQQVHELSLQHFLEGKRWEDVAKAIKDDVPATAKYKAALIARTETSRASGQFTMVRALHMGSEGYIWRSTGDADVRPRHRVLNGTYQKWSDPPVASEPGQREMRYHPGSGPNCRCTAEVVMPDEPQADRRVTEEKSVAYLTSLRPEAESLNERYRAGKLSYADYTAKLNDLAQTLEV